MKKVEVLKRINPKFLNGVAHRGYHNERFTENGLNAFKNALDNDLAIELDVHLTKDNELIVCHDPNLVRTTSKEGIIENLTIEEIKTNYLLNDGEKVPTLKEVLDLIDEKVPMVIELKPDTNTKNYKKLALRVMKELERVKDKANFIIISFYPQCLLPIKKYNFVRCLLIAQKYEWIFNLRFLFEGLDIDYHYFNKNKKYQKLVKNKFMMAWTIEDKETFKEVSNYVDSVTFQYIDKNDLKN